MKCPNCKEEIKGLIHYQSGYNRYDFWVDDDEATYQLDTFTEDNNVSEYECPECKKVLFTDEDEAVKFLKGEQLA